MAQRKQITWADLRVGVFVFAGLVTLAVGIFWVTGAGSLGPKYRLFTYLPEVEGLAAGAPVRLDGVDVGTVEQVRKQLIAAMDGGDTSIETIAKKLGTSARSLQRRLAEEGTRYNDLLSEIRAEFAKRYLARGSISASEVAYLLGFTEPPAFFKAFKRWTGMTPREFQLGSALG